LLNLVVIVSPNICAASGSSRL
jgi:hypothetical protein